MFSRNEAASWCEEHDFLIDIYRTRKEEGEITYHIHAQFEPDEAVEDSWATLYDDFPDGISASVCQKKELSMRFIRGTQSLDDPLEFIMSDETIDSYGDIIVAKGWNLSNFKLNPIALWGHDHKSPIGAWEKVRVSGKQLIGKLKFAAAGTSEEIDVLRKLVEQRIIKAVSVGFQPIEYEEIDKENPWGGIKFLKSMLHECSLVSVGANPNALAVAKSYGLNEIQLKDILNHGRDIHGRNAAPLAKIERTIGTAEKILSRAGCPTSTITVH